MERYRAYLQLTKACNAQCKMCDFWKNEKEVFERDHFFRLIDLLVSEWIKWITFWWWEPFLYEHIYDLIKYAKQKDLNTEIITNGTVIDKEKIKDSIEYIDEILFSIDSWIESVHNKIRWKSFIYKKAVANLAYISELRKTLNTKLQIIIDTTLQKDNFDTFETVLDLAKEYNTKINFDPVQLIWYGNNRERNWLTLSEDEAFILEKNLLDFWKKNSFYLLQSKDSIKRIIRYFKGYKIENYCTSLNKDVLIDPSWDVLKCWGSSEVVYNIFENKGIKKDKLKMDQSCYSCWFTHVRDDDYFTGYSVTNDVFEWNTY